MLFCLIGDVATKKKAERCREFHEKWIMNCSFVEKNGKAICLVYNAIVSSLKKYNIKRHCQTHTNFIREHLVGSELRKFWITNCSAVAACSCSAV